MSVGVGVFVIPLPVFGGSTAPTGQFTVPMVVASGHGASQANFDIPKPVFNGTGVSGNNHGRFSIPKSVFTGSGKSEVAGVGVFVIPRPVFSGNFAGNGRGVFVIPAPVFTDIHPDTGIGSFVIPLIHGLGYGRALPVAPIRKGVVMNLVNQAISTYNSFSFESLGYFDGHLYGANENGIYLLEGDRDGMAYIQSKLKTGPLDFGNNFVKYLRDIWLTYRSDGQLAIVLATKENEGDRTEEFPTVIVESDIHEERVPGPRGLRGRYYMIELKNLSGSDFDLAQISIMIDAIRKRIR